MAIRATTLGIISAPPIPDNARAMTKAVKLFVNPLINDHRTNHAPPARRTFLWPYTAPKRPLIKTNVPCVNLRIR